MAGLSGGPEATAQAIANTIGTKINALITQVNALYSDYQLPTIPTTAIYVLEQDVIPEYPAIVVSYLATNETADAAPNWGEVEHHFDVTVILTSDTKDSIQRAAQRYLWILWDLFKKNQVLDNSLSGLNGIDTPRMGRSQVYTLKGKSSGVLMMDAGIELVVHVIESTY